MMTYCTISKERVKKHAEVFTPAGVVFEMVMQDGLREIFQDVDKTVFDPAVGEGQFPCAELVWKMFNQIENLNEDIALRALNSLYSMDIQAESAEKARKHLLLTLCDAYNFFTGKIFTNIGEAYAIVNKNVMVGDSLKFMNELAGTTNFPKKRKRR